MPITYVHIEWPDHKTGQVYSPSSVIKEYFKSGERLSVEKFLAACTEGLNAASERVQQKFGYTCTSAIAELERINILCQNYDISKKVKIISVSIN
jgi:uncharacterized repeat protein (TIGR04042 family)